MAGWRASSGPTTARSRAAILRRLRTHFESRGVLEVDTPALSRYAVSDIQIESLEVSSTLTAAPLYLHTSPEFCMKRLLASGYPDIYSICRVFRDGESGRNHQPEFTMIEWYRLGMNLDEIITDAIHTIAAALGDRIDPASATCLDYVDAFAEVCGLNPLAASAGELMQAAGADPQLRDAIGDIRDDWLDLLMATQVVPNFPQDRLTIVQHYPARQAALARLSPDDDRVADRFEVFLGDIELANGYVELTETGEQAARIARDQSERARTGRPQRPHDPDLLAALEHGLPQCAGVAMGLERLQMIHDRIDDIRDVVTFAYGAADD